MEEFEDIIDELRIHAIKLAKPWGNRFAPDELINEAWISSQKTEKRPTKKQVIQRAIWDMKDYIRREMGRKNAKYRTSFLINADDIINTTNEEDRKNSSFDLLLQDKERLKDKNLFYMENYEFVLDLLLKFPDPQELKVLFYHYFCEKKQIEICKMYNLSQGRISGLVKSGLEKCRKGLKILE